MKSDAEWRAQVEQIVQEASLMADMSGVWSYAVPVARLTALLAVSSPRQESDQEPPRPSITDAVNEAVAAGCDCGHPLAWHGRHGCYAIGRSGACCCNYVGSFGAASRAEAAGSSLCPKNSLAAVASLPGQTDDEKEQ